ncbi:helix-turn-helix transcriptional regulator [Nocardia sp. NPDC050697]|uniref:helix-turn-helix domain-containing protein n=1 Tax=Nocardia sp. NPDC050697 TaxID=3155158 RepID=UPI0034085B7C
MSKLSEILGLYMRVNQVSFRGMAKEIGIPVTTLNRIVTGVSEPSAHNLVKILDWLLKEEPS